MAAPVEAYTRGAVGGVGRLSPPPVEMDELLKPPGHTCPQIDAAQRYMRRLAWRVKNKPDASEDEVRALLREGLAVLEQVREENKQLRAAYYAMRKKATGA